MNTQCQSLYYLRYENKLDRILFLVNSLHDMITNTVYSSNYTLKHQIMRIRGICNTLDMENTFKSLLYQTTTVSK